MRQRATCNRANLGMATAEKAKRGPRDYLKQRGRIWQVRFQYPHDLRESAMDLYGADDWPSVRLHAPNSTNPHINQQRTPITLVFKRK